LPVPTRFRSGVTTIGDGAVIGANSVVTQDIPGAVIAAGSPAKVLREIEFRGRDPEAPDS
jgi:acetyltransferase-like isoleucine patch superfamily enzyme